MNRAHRVQVLVLAVLCLFPVLVLAQAQVPEQPIAASAATGQQLASRLHGLKSVLGKANLDAALADRIGFRVVTLRDGTYQLRAYDTTNGQFVDASHPTVDKQIRQLTSTRFESKVDATIAQERLGNLDFKAVKLADGQYQLRPYDARSGRFVAYKDDAFMRSVVGDVPEQRFASAADAESAGRYLGKDGLKARAVDLQGRYTQEISKIDPAPGAPKASRTNVDAGGVRGAADAEGTRAAVDADGARPSVTADEASVPAEPTQPGASSSGRLAGLKSSFTSAVKGALPSIPLALATGVAFNVAQQIREGRNVDMGTAVGSVLEPRFLGSMLGSVLGGIGGTMAGNAVAGVAGPLAPLVRAGLTIGGAMLGANLGGQTEIDWGRLAFNTAFLSVAALVMPANPILGFALMTAAGVVSDKLYDEIFGNEQGESQESTPAAEPVTTSRSVSESTTSSQPVSEPTTSVSSQVSQASDGSRPATGTTTRPATDPEDPFATLPVTSNGQ